MFMTAKGHNVFTKTQDYLHELDQFEAEFRRKMESDLKLKEQQNAKSLLLFKRSNESKLDELDSRLNATFSKLEDALNGKKKALRSRMDEHRSYLSNVEAEYNAMTKDLNSKMKDSLVLIDEDRTYYNESLKKCKLIISKTNCFDLKHKNRDRERESAITEIGRDITRNHKANHCKLIESKHALNRFVNKLEAFSMSIHHSEYHRICKWLESLAVFQQKLDFMDPLKQRDSQNVQNLKQSESEHPHKTPPPPPSMKDSEIGPCCLCILWCLYCF